MTIDDDWFGQANCLGVDTRLFYTERGEPTGHARQVCAGGTRRTKPCVAVGCSNLQDAWGFCWAHYFGTRPEPLYCTCARPDVDGVDMCRHCLRAHRPSVFARYGWSLEAAS